ncbi:MAG: DNA polymerase [Actinomycetaceae bacterium]|nr:DNA polymerase [Actinomycetaceae bacterium]
MRELSIDIETFSTTDLASAGVYKYASDEFFQILLFAYKEDDQAARVVDVAQGEQIPQRILKALTDPSVVKHAFNAQFERVCLSRHLGRQLEPEQCHCTMVHALHAGMPGSLKQASISLGLDQRKNTAGVRLIKKFSVPSSRNTLTPGGRTLPASDPTGWEQFKQYCVQDVEVEYAVRQALRHREPSHDTWSEYWLDQHINDLGVRVDTRFATAAQHVGGQHYAKTLNEAKTLTGLDNPNSVTQLQDWLTSQGVDMPSLTKQQVATAIDDPATPDTVRRVLELRQDMSRTSTKKYDAMLACALNEPSGEARAHGLLQFYGAGRTGRWAGRLVQVQNLPRNHMHGLDQARQAVAKLDPDTVEMLYDVPDTLSQLIRTALIPSDGYEFTVCDYSAIEARVIAWLAGEQWRLDAFKQGEDIYCTTASRMFKVPVEKHGQNAHLRQKGKVAELACGYGGSVGALKAMGALNMGLTESELKPIVKAWRDSSPAITRLWWTVDQAARDAITTSRTTTAGRCTFTLEHDALAVTLPSGRRLYYHDPHVKPGRYGKPVITFKGVNSMRAWAPLETYGPKLVENITQATARDILAHALTELHEASYRTVMHVHDEVVIETPKDEAHLNHVAALMTRAPAWADGLPLAADGYTCDYYQKD